MEITKISTKKIAHSGDNLDLISKMAGLEGFEPPNARTKNLVPYHLATAHY